MGYQHEDKGESLEDTEVKGTLPIGSHIATKRTPRMLHETSFATSALTSSRSQKRPPGFIASSLDFKSSPASASVAPNIVTTKPGMNMKNNNKQQEENLEREKQYQQQRQFRSGHPTRAQGNFGPPPHSVKSLEDLENMSEEQIYKLFMDDPEFHQAFLKATGKGEHKGDDVPSSAPVGAKNGRRSAGKKPSKSSNSKRSSTNSKTLKYKDTEREVPYFQWLFLFILVGAAVYKILKSCSSPTTTKDLSGISKNAITRKEKRKKGVKPGKKSATKKIIAVEKVRPNLPVNDNEAVEKIAAEKIAVEKIAVEKIAVEKIAVEKISSSRRKRKKKASKTSSTTIACTISDEKKENDLAQKQHQQHEPDLCSSDGSPGKNQPETAKLDLVIQVESGLVSSPTINESDEVWQTVTNSSKGDRKGKTIIDSNLLEEKNVLDPTVVDNKGDHNNILEPKNEAIEHLSQQSMVESNLSVRETKTKKEKDKIASLNYEKENTNVASKNTAVIVGAGHVVEENEVVSEAKHKKTLDNDSNGKSATTTEDDAALALQLHEEEVNLSRAANGNPQEEVWEEVTTKKKKGIKSEPIAV